jgi:hypothetical protein
VIEYPAAPAASAFVAAAPVGAAFVAPAVVAAGFADSAAPAVPAVMVAVMIARLVGGAVPRRMGEAPIFVCAVFVPVVIVSAVFAS